MNTQFQVITKVPQLDKETHTVNGGNLAAAFVFLQVAKENESNGYLGLWKPDAGSMLVARTEVFCLGEILIIDLSGREISGQGRRADKWDVEYEVFNELESAIECAKKVTNRE